MDAFIINGGKPLIGNVKIGGAKNSALKLMCAALLTDKPVILHNVPELDDITSMARLLAHLGAKLGSYENNTLEIHADNVNDLTAPYELVRRMRASIIVLGPLLARFGKVKVSLPGGCAIGTRPVDMHLKALEQMGAKIEIDAGYVIAEAKQLVGAEIFFEKVSVGATENILMAATLAEGETVLHNAAREPEIVDLANMLIKMGAKIEGAGSETIKITGVASLGGVEHTTVADRIEAGSYILAAAITNGDVLLENVPANIMGASLPKMREAGIIITEEGAGLRAKSSGIIKATNVITAPYPGFATDMQAQFMAYMCLANGTSTIEETIFENRFMHVPELARMGA
ncbi:MAG: UDP-N-acetylglucosamine 1-carboxyvinyltransferase, partial [Rickettsiales bacterium]